ncbi:MAG: putative flavin-nucleotide-binding protein [Microbacteriaceae bacterium]|nr:putative flavin-nucleotide-binding protein [Microbacteriaceae bacterium]
MSAEPVGMGDTGPEPAGPEPTSPAGQSRPRTKPTRVTEKFPEQERAALDALLDVSMLGHFAFVVDGEPRILPIAIARDGDSVLLHGSTGSPWLRLLGTGVAVAMSVVELSAIVVARSAFESSMTYRSAVIFGRCSVVPADDKVRSLDVVTDSLIPGRVAEVRGHRAKELAATLVLRLSVDEWSLKVSDAWPEDEADDVAGPAWAGMVPLATGFTAALPTHDLRDGIELPPSVQALLGNPAR